MDIEKIHNATGQMVRTVIEVYHPGDVASAQRYLEEGARFRLHGIVAKSVDKT